MPVTAAGRGDHCDDEFDYPTTTAVSMTARERKEGESDPSNGIFAKLGRAENEFLKLHPPLMHFMEF